jgi:uncharacterized protein YejL (UPF0352 family)
MGNSIFFTSKFQPLVKLVLLNFFTSKFQPLMKLVLLNFFTSKFQLPVRLVLLVVGSSVAASINGSGVISAMKNTYKFQLPVKLVLLVVGSSVAASINGSGVISAMTSGLGSVAVVVLLSHLVYKTLCKGSNM